MHGSLLRKLGVLHGLLAMAPALAADSAQISPSHAGTSLSESALAAHMKELQAIADASGGNRAAGRAGHEASADYIQSQLAESGLRVWREPFTFESHNAQATVNVSGQGLLDASLIGDYSTPPEGVTGSVMTPTDQRGCSAASWRGMELRGNVAIVRTQSGPDCNLMVQVNTARALGAAALLVFPVSVGIPLDFPAVFLRDDSQAEQLIERAAQGVAGSAQVITSFNIEQRHSFNLLAETRAEGPTIMLGAHLDSVDAGPGMDDNASGAAAVLEIARTLAQHPSASRLQFAWWSAEEHGLLGSTAYVQRLAKENPAALASIRAYLNADMIGSPNHVFALYDPTEEGPIAQRQHIHDALDSWFEQEGLPRRLMTSQMFSDHLPFATCGLAIGGASSFAGRGNKTPEEQAQFGGEAGQPYSPHYHRASDRLENTAQRAWAPLANALAHATAALAQSPPAPATPHCSGLEALSRAAIRHAHAEPDSWPQTRN